MHMTATYSPDDNKLRLYTSTRLDADTYTRVRAAGFIYAPKQELFVAPTWTPQREDLLLELCGEIDDEDMTLTARAEDRAERFEAYSGKREAEADRAHEAVATLAEGIPFGQPILVGHHSERRARRDAEKIQNGMRRAVRLWETSTYWSQRAEGAIRHAKHKERPDVRARRIKGIDADKRKAEKTTTEAEKFIAAWETDGLTWKQARAIANYDHVHRAFPVAEYPRRPICAECDRPMSPTAETCGAARVFKREDGERETVTCAGLPKPASTYEGSMSLWSALAGIITPEQAREIATSAHRRVIAANARWIAHYTNRLTYERAMLSEAIGVPDVSERFPNIEPGGRVLIDSEWCTVIRVNKSNGKTSTLTTNRRYVRKVGIEEVRDYTPPDAFEAEAVKRATKPPPLCNYPGAGFRHMTKADYERRYHFIRATTPGRPDPSCEPQYVAHRVRCHLKGGGGLDCHSAVGVYLTDERLKFPPIADEQKAVALAEARSEPPAVTPPESDLPTVKAKAARRSAARERHETQQSNPFAAMRDALRSGVAVVPVSAPQLFPTPRDVARRMVDACGTVAGARVLEPSAGTGEILRAILNNATGADCVRVVAVEINATLADRLRQQRDLTVYANAQNFDVRQADFLECTPDDLGAFDFVLMNPPFSDGADIEHIEHAQRFLKPGGRIVAICANGPRQRAKLMPLVQQHAGEWIDLPADTFRSSGTSVRAAMLTFQAS